MMATSFNQLVNTYTVPNVAAPVAPAVNTSEIKVDDNQLIPTTSGQVNDQVSASQTQGTATTSATPTDTTAQTVDTAKVGDQIDNTVDKFEAAKGTLDTASTVQGQLAELSKQFEGGNTPAWAAGALRTADDAAMARGLGSSSIAGAARTQAALEAALPIAAADAQANLTMQLQNLNNEQAVSVQKNNARLSSLITDVASENASRQFNASSKQQSEQFNSNLKSQVQQFNAAQINAMSQFNAGEANAIAQFNAQIESQRQQFNAANRLVIDQANAKWRQEVTTVNNQEKNENNRLAAQLKSEMTLADYNNRAQARRDSINYAFTASENAKTRAVELVISQMSSDDSEEARKSAQKSNMWQAVGSAIAAVFS